MGKFGHCASWTHTEPSIHLPRFQCQLADAAFYDPAAAVHLDDFGDDVIEVCADAVEAVEARLLVYHLLIERVAVVLGWLPVNGAGFVLDEASWVVLPLEVDKSPPRGLGGSVLKEPRDICLKILYL